MDVILNQQFWEALFEKFTDEKLLATVILCLVLALLAYFMFPAKNAGEKIRFAVFISIAALFSVVVLSVTNSMESGGIGSRVPETVDIPLKAEDIKKIPGVRVIPASSVSSGKNIAIGPLPNLYGSDVIMNAPPYHKIENSAVFDIPDIVAGDYLLCIRYAAASARPINVAVNGQQASNNVLDEATGGWLPANQKWKYAGFVTLVEGHNQIRLYRSDAFPHISRLKLIPKADGLKCD